MTAVQKPYYKIFDEQVQDKPWLTMVHGFSQNHRYFSEQIPCFQQYFRLLLVDLRGHGQSMDIAGPYGIEEYVDDVNTVLDEVGITQTHYWGTHTGAAIGLVLALRNSRRLTSLVLEAPSLPGFDMPRTAELLERAGSIAQSEGLETALEDWFEYADWFAYIREHPEQCRAGAHQKMISEFQGASWLSSLVPRTLTPVADRLAEISCPVLLYNGEYDLHDFQRVAAMLESELPDVRRIEIPQAGGFPGWENPQTVNELVHSFLRKPSTKFMSSGKKRKKSFSKTP